MASSHLLFQCSDEEVLAWLADRFCSFLIDAPAHWRIRFVVNEPTPDFLVSPREVFPDRAEITATHNGLTIRGRGWRGQVHFGRRTVEMSGVRATYPVDRVLRYLLPLLVDDGLVIHGGMLEGEHGAWAFSGPSGSGKSTLCKLLPKQARCDEMVAVRRVHDEWIAQALPFWSARPAANRLRGIYLIAHGASDYRTQVTSTGAARQLSREILWPVAEPEALGHRLDLLGRLVAEVPVWDLHFVPTPAVWRVIDEDAA